jgi:hypothetical protein
MNAEELARQFQEVYTRIATQLGQGATPLPDQQIVLAVCREILKGRVIVNLASRQDSIKYG